MSQPPEPQPPRPEGANADDGDDHDGESGQRITVHVKTPNKNLDKKSFTLGENTLVKKFKSMISKEFDTPIERLCLIFAGKILADKETMSTYSIKDGMTVHLVIRSANVPSGSRAASGSASTATASPAASTVPPPAPPTGQPPPSAANLSSLAGRLQSGNFMQMQQQLMSDPEFVRQVLDSPITQNLMSNPDIMMNLMQSSPQMRQLLDRNPELSHMLNNPSVMRQIMEMSRNPGMMQELRRNLDRAMSNLESLPGGQNALQRIWTDLEEPMMNAAQEYGYNPFAALGDRQASENGSSQNVTGENSAPLPNPWAPNAEGSTNAATGAGGLGGLAGLAGLGGLGGLGTGGAQSTNSSASFMQQLMGNDQMMQALLDSSWVQSLLSNPDVAANIMSNNPLLAGNPALQEEMRTMLPHLLQDRSLLSALARPEVISALRQIQDGVEKLRNAAPELCGFLNFTNPLLAAGSTGGTTTQPSPSQPQGQRDQNAFQELINRMTVRMAEQGISSTPPEERFSYQLQVLQNMGFVDRQANIQALLATSGDVNAAIDRLLNQSSNHGAA